jgi:hypothetical protein
VVGYGSGIVFPALCLCLIVVTTYLNTYLLCYGASQCARHQSDRVEFGVWGHSQQLLICLLPMREGVGGYGGGILCIYHQMRAAIAREEDS